MNHLCRGYVGDYSGPCYHPAREMSFYCECGEGVEQKCSDDRCDKGICSEHEMACEVCDRKCCQKCITWYAYGEFWLCRECLKTMPAEYEKDNPRNEKEPT